MRLNDKVTYGFYQLKDIPVTVKKIHDFKKLGKGWSYGEGEPFKGSILNDAISLIREAFNLAFYTTDAFPGLNGEVMCTIYHEDNYLEFTLEPDGNVTFAREKSDDEICYQEGLSLQDAKEKIGEFRKEIWNTYEFSTQYITTPECVGSLAPHLRTQENPRESQSSANAASTNSVQPPVDTYQNTIAEFLRNLRCFGTSQQKFCLPTVS